MKSILTSHRIKLKLYTFSYERGKIYGFDTNTDYVVYPQDPKFPINSLWGNFPFSRFKNYSRTEIYIRWTIKKTDKVNIRIYIIWQKNQKLLFCRPTWFLRVYRRTVAWAMHLTVVRAARTSVVRSTFIIHLDAPAIRKSANSTTEQLAEHLTIKSMGAEWFGFNRSRYFWRFEGNFLKDFHWTVYDLILHYIWCWQTSFRFKSFSDKLCCISKILYIIHCWVNSFDIIGGHCCQKVSYH